MNYLKGISLAALSLFLLQNPIFGQAILDAGPDEELTGSELAVLWRNRDVGNAKIRGSFSRVGDNQYAIAGAGADIWGVADGFQYAHVTFDGDGQIVARVSALENVDPWAKVGLMIRESLAPDSRYGMVAITPTNGVIFQYREQSGGISTLAQRNLRSKIDLAPDPDVPSQMRVPCWLRLIRRGNVLIGLCSTNGTSWEWVGTAPLENAPNELFIGLVASSHSESKTCAATIDQVSLLSPPDVDSTRTAGSGDGIIGRYFGRSDFGGVAISRLDATINFDWTTNSPFEGFVSDNFSIRWEGELQAELTETYALHLVSDDRARLWVNGRLLIDDSSEHAAQESTATIKMIAGQRYLLRIDYVENKQDASVKLLWSSFSTPKQIIPQTQLYSRITDSDRDTIPDLWELAFNLAPNDQSDALNDPDGDGTSNLDEYKAGTNPRRAEASVAGLPLPWVSRDIGQVRVAGSADYANGAFTVAGSGEDVWANADSFQFVSRPFSGDGQMIVRVIAQQNTDPWAKAGIMFRESLSDDSRHAFVALTPENGVSFQLRSEPGAGCAEDSGGVATLPCWLKLTRNGDVFRAYRSADGIQWEWIASERIGMAQAIYAGIAVSSHDVGRLSSAQFDNTSFSNAESIADRIVGAGDGLLATYFDVSSTNSAVQVDKTVDFNWAEGSPADVIPRDNFSARWVGLVEPQYSELYAFHVISDDGARLWIEGAKIVDAWSDRAATKVTGKVFLKAGHKYLIKLEFYERTGQAMLKLLWSSPSTAKEIVPTRQLYSPLNIYYSAIEDKDQDRMPDAWERANGLDDTDFNDATADPDGDGLSNYEEYNAGTNPWKPDTDGDGIPDLWEVNHGLNPIDPADANQDRDRDGLTNAEEYAAGTNPDSADTDGDGLPDEMEVKETGTDPLGSDIEEIVNVAEVNGSAVIGTLGEWGIEGSSIFAKGSRGSVEYELNVPRADVYRLEVAGASHRQSDPDPSFDLLLFVDNEYLGRSTLIPSRGGEGTVHQFTPWLTSGVHRVRVFWDNASWLRSLALVSIRMQALVGSDANKNGVTDWVEARLRSQCRVSTGVIESPTAPFCLEGRGGYLSMLTINETSGARRAGKNGWYCDIPLTAVGNTSVAVSFQNGGLLATNQIHWKPTNLLEANDLNVRQGDALLLTAIPPDQTGGTFTITVIGVTNYSGSAARPIICAFPQAGTFTVRGVYLSPAGLSLSRSIQVTVVAKPALNANPATWVGKSRLFDLPPRSPAVVIQPDAALTLSPIKSLPDGGVRFNLATDIQEVRSIVARVGTNGPILNEIPVSGFRLYSASETSVRVLTEYDDGSRLVEMGVVLSPLVPEVTVRLQIQVGGILFEDGTLSKVLTADDFGPIGEAKVRFIMPASAKTSVCHTTRAYQGEIFLGIHP